MASVGWQVGAGGVPIPISSISWSTYGKKSGRPGASGKTRPTLASIFPLRDVHGSGSTSAGSSPTRTLAPALSPKPVKATESADSIVLVSSDGANFRVSRSVLAYASPVFHQLLSSLNATRSLEGHSPASTSSSRSSVISEADTLCLSNELLADGTPVIRMPEDGKTLDALLRYLYPFAPSPSELFTEQPYRLLLDKIKPVLFAAYKYSIRPILDEICGRLLSDLVLPHDEEGDTFSLRVYAIACLVKRRSLAEAAAYETLRIRIDGVYFPELEVIPAIHYFQLLEYRRRCATAVLDLIASKQVQELGGDSTKGKTQPVFQTCRQCRTRGQSRESRAFWQNFQSRTEEDLRESPRSQQLFNSEFLLLVLQSTVECEDCREEMLKSWKTTSVLLKDEIERCIHGIDFDLSALEESNQKTEEKKKDGKMLNVLHKFMTLR